jgi:hypothetical protein
LLSPGAERAVTTIFGTRNELARVAKAPAFYGTTAETAMGLLALALAHGQRIDVEALAAQVMLWPDVLRWLDRVALLRERQPDALVSHLVGALGAASERVCEALANGENGADTFTVI